ncbi:hypothetical protein E2C01_095279 [Portunus trituberculatus]|uniref:Uncharacterized protein n=1 Tax=Portunus trituberculatus TaxID=210409 RepID=A0A5B7K3T4_PORTR|nr:hypothetical protein [Portunus trituberculatus]
MRRRIITGRQGTGKQLAADQRKEAGRAHTIRSTGTAHIHLIQILLRAGATRAFVRLWISLREARLCGADSFQRPWRRGGKAGSCCGVAWREDQGEASWEKRRREEKVMYQRKKKKEKRRRMEDGEEQG